MPIGITILTCPTVCSCSSSSLRPSRLVPQEDRCPWIRYSKPPRPAKASPSSTPRAIRVIGEQRDVKRPRCACLLTANTLSICCWCVGRRTPTITLRSGESRGESIGFGSKRTPHLREAGRRGLHLPRRHRRHHTGGRRLRRAVDGSDALRASEHARQVH